MRFLIFIVLIFIVLIFTAFLDACESFGGKRSIESERLVEEASILCGDTDCQDSAQAIKILNVAIELDPEFTRAYFHRALAHAKSKEYTLAFNDFSMAIQLEPEFSLVYFHRALTHAELKEYTLAISNFTMAIELNPEFSRAYYHRAVAYGDLGIHVMASKDYITSIDLNYGSTLRKACEDFIKHCKLLEINVSVIQFCSMIPKYCPQEDIKPID